jgi:hypothetical protein
MLDTCVWQSPFSLSDYQDLSITYPELESFFIKRLKVRKVTPSMLVEEITQMVAKSGPDIDKIRQRLVEVGLILAKGTIDKATEEALDELAAHEFLPLKLDDGTSVLVNEGFAIPDHARYNEAFMEDEVLLNFTIDEVQILHVMFEYLDLQYRYVSNVVTEKSTVGDNPRSDDVLSQELQVKAYALYW